MLKRGIVTRALNRFALRKNGKHGFSFFRIFSISLPGFFFLPRERESDDASLISSSHRTHAPAFKLSGLELVHCRDNLSPYSREREERETDRDGVREDDTRKKTENNRFAENGQR